jgi:hypothetical protein
LQRIGLAHHGDYGSDKAAGGEKKGKKKSEKIQRMIMEAEVLRSRNKIGDALAMFEQILVQVCTETFRPPPPGLSALC